MKVTATTRESMRKAATMECSITFHATHIPLPLLLSTPPAATFPLRQVTLIRESGTPHTAEYGRQDGGQQTARRRHSQPASIEPIVATVAAVEGQYRNEWEHDNEETTGESMG
eukprot:GHVU01148276.1.p7 GENE.GHVU01148276.1~~GHVU01148276.1.p7  ORF type:complete len:113 (+),score=17.23 GHVU01148276.1:2199-2537(+)